MTMTTSGTTLNVCIAQINYDSVDIHEHVKRIKDIIQAYHHADLIVFPELVLHGHPSFERPEGFLYRKMKALYGPISEDLYNFVRKTNTRVVIGELKRWGQKYYNVATCVDRTQIQRYTKTHVHWTESFVPGKELKVFETPFGKMGITICFDAAFSEVWRVLALRGANIILNISAVPRSFPVDYMWRRLRGAAINNQVYVVYANRPGAHFSGHSAVFDPTGRVVASAGPENQILESRIDLEQVMHWRDEESIYPNRRPLLYREIVNRHRKGPAEENLIDGHGRP